MIDNSARYGLCNPAFRDDIGYTMLGRMVGNSIEDLDEYRISGTEYTMDGMKFKQMLNSDEFESSTKKDKIKKGLIWGAVGVVALLAGWKFRGKIKDLLKKIPGVAGLKTKITNKFSGIKSKIKMPSLKGIKQRLKKLFKRK